MKRNGSIIEFEHDYEIRDLINIVERYELRNPSQSSFQDLLVKMIKIDCSEYDDLSELLEIITRYASQRSADKNFKTLKKLYDHVSGIKLEADNHMYEKALDDAEEMSVITSDEGSDE